MSFDGQLASSALQGALPCPALDHYLPDACNGPYWSRQRVRSQVLASPRFVWRPQGGTSCHAGCHPLRQLRCTVCLSVTCTLALLKLPHVRRRRLGPERAVGGCAGHAHAAPGGPQGPACCTGRALAGRTGRHEAMHPLSCWLKRRLVRQAACAAEPDACCQLATGKRDDVFA